MKFLIIIALMGLLCPGAESVKLSENDYQNIDQMLEFGAHVFMSFLDKVKEATEKMVKDDMLRTNRIAIQGHWNSFKETANRISAEERGKGVQDDLVVAARTLRRLVLYYKDDVTQMYTTIVTEQNVQHYLPLVETVKGTIQRAKVNEVWSNVISNCLPDAPPVDSNPLDFLCYLLSTNAVETVTVYIFKLGMEVISEMKKINFDQVNESMWNKLEEFRSKMNEIEAIEKEKKEDGLVTLATVTSKVIVFYWERYLNSSDTPELGKEYEEVARKLKDQNFEEELKAIVDKETLDELLSLHFDFAKEFYFIGLQPAILVMSSDFERFLRTGRVVGMRAVVDTYTIYEWLSKKGVFSEMKKVYFRAVDVALALAGTDEVKYLKETYFEKWKSFRKELNAFVEKERGKEHVLLPQIRGVAQMIIKKSEAFVDRVNADISDERVGFLAWNWVIIRQKCIDKLLASGALTEESIKEAKSFFTNNLQGLYEKYEEFTKGMDPKRVEDTFKALVKVTMVGFNFIYEPLAQAWDFVLF
ncbi:uncharacterized protein [Hoplias malabaricus]|uniref:uncharacterized protein n=1 Tax=Hoplias malabaricus TaxID=27720 RepID=UPI003461DBA4